MILTVVHLFDLNRFTYKRILLEFNPRFKRSYVPSGREAIALGLPIYLFLHSDNFSLYFTIFTLF